MSTLEVVSTRAVVSAQNRLAQRGEHGQATSEYAVVILIVIALGLAIVQVASGGMLSGLFGDLLKKVLQSRGQSDSLMTKRNMNQRGQAMVELAVAIPFVVLLLMLVVEVGIVMFDQLAVAQAAREGARAAAVDPTPGAAAAAADRATRLDASRLSVDSGPRPGSDGLVHVVVSYKARILMPFTDQVLLQPVVTSTAAMRVEAG